MPSARAQPDLALVRGAILFLAALAVLAPACGGGKSNGGKPDGAISDGSGETACSGTGGMRKPNGQGCGCNGDCGSGFCVDGFCCNSACTETCKSCNNPASLGTCTFVPTGLPPRTTSTCPRSEVSTCGLDGTCNGAGACRKFSPGTVCKPGACDGAAVNSVNVCDSAGRCKPGPATVCAPFNCEAASNKCFASCKADSDCVSGVKCVSGSCGPKPRAAVCAKNTDCASGFCSDGLCCNVACKGACVACNQVGREGTCWPSDPGLPDPRNVCQDQGAPTCGRTGTCDGFGGCAMYPAETICTAPSCAGDRLNTAGTCNGLGLCRPQGVQNCPPYRCVDGACNVKCTSDNDCQAGHACVSGSCGPKTTGQSCAKGTECKSGFCVDGVCCADLCQGSCRSCALPSSMGRCASIPGGSPDPRSVCTDQGASSCGTDGACDGAGGCRRYKAGTECQAERCEANVYTPAATCNNTGQCVPPTSLPCAPFACNGARCFAGCTSDANCVSPNVCDARNSCGKKTNGASCSDKVECASGFCAQGVCCATACASACRSCALSGTLGACTNVASGAPDPASTCLAQSPPSCGTNGRCEAGACQKYAQGIPCADPSCPMGGTTFTPGSACDGAGSCVTPASTSCFPFRCGAAACKATCTADADCAMPAVCANGSCGLKPPGGTCADGQECMTGFCAQGVCCRTACTGTCLSCALAATAGTCSPVPSGGTDPTSTCANAGAANCDGTGFCDGKGACELYAAGTPCAPPACPAGTASQTLGRTCDGAGTCKPASTQSCAPFTCNGTACRTTCTADADCAAPNICDLQTNACGNKKRLGQTCNSVDDCLTGNSCVDGVCCSTGTCGTCQACNIPGREGTCSEVPEDAAEPHGRCVASPPCGFVGTCDGAGGCQNAPAVTSCGMPSCTGSTLTPVGFCNGAGTCKQNPTSCGPYVCGSGATCLTTCTATGDCVTGFTCQGGSCTDLLGNGSACVNAGQCISGHCLDQVCCGSATCPSCTSCAVAGSEGQCAPVPEGSADPKAVCVNMAASTCGTIGTCDGTGACAFHPVGTTCAPATCPAGGAMLTSASTCDGTGTCLPGVTTSCSPYACGATNVCTQAPCTDPSDCAAGHTCDPGTGECL
jgi:hypothetical protein